MGTYRKKPVEVQAFRFNGDQTDSSNVPDWFLAEFPKGKWFVASFREDETGIYRKCIMIYTLEGLVTAKPGDWIIRGVVGELYPCRDDIFQATYEAVETPT